jgi:hypothetical protein
VSAWIKRVCPGCGATNMGETQVCLLCQHTLPSQVPAQPATLVQQPALQPGTAWHLVVVKGPTLGRVYRLSERLSLGRDFSNDIQLNDGQVSRKHALIQQVQDAYVVIDQDSTNGTFVNDQRIGSPTLLAHGTVITIGFTQFRVQAYS